jgi:hypothetical protein
MSLASRRSPLSNLEGGVASGTKVGSVKKIVQISFEATAVKKSRGISRA